MMNLHCLELFYHVATQGGIVAACRNMPYGIQQPAVSVQMIRFEEQLGVKLFHRKPFKLTMAGMRLYERIAPFFSHLDDIENEVRGGTRKEIRIAGPSDFLRDYVPGLLAQLRKKQADLSAILFEATQQSASEMIMSGKIDLAVFARETIIPKSLNYRSLIHLPLVFLIKKSDKTATPDLWMKPGKRLLPPLIGLQKSEFISQLFFQELTRRKVEWNLSIETGNLDSINHYVKSGMGVGLSVRIPGRTYGKEIIEYSMKGMPSVEVGCLWREGIGAVAADYLSTLMRR